MYPSWWTASNKDLSSSRCVQRPRRPPTQMMPNPRDHMINVTTPKCCTDAFFLFCLFVCINTPGASNTSCTFLFAHHSFFSPGRVVFRTILVFHVVYCLYFVFFCHARGSIAVSTITIPVLHPRHLSSFMRYTFTFLYSPNLLGYLLPNTRLPLGYPGMTDTYDACTLSTTAPLSLTLFYHSHNFLPSSCYRCSISPERFENENLNEHPDAAWLSLSE